MNFSLPPQLPDNIDVEKMETSYNALALEKYHYKDNASDFIYQLRLQYSSSNTTKNNKPRIPDWMSKSGKAEYFDWVDKDLEPAINQMG